MEDDCEGKLTIIHLREAIDSLEERQKAIMEYRLFAELPFREIAILLGMKETTVKVSYSRTKIKIREKLKEDYGYEI